AMALFMQIVGWLSRCYGRGRNPDTQALLRIAQTISHLEAHFAEPARLDDLAGIAHMSKRGFVRTFRAATGQSPIAYLIQIRVNGAASLLRSSHLSITEIAYRTGFRDSNYFSRQFRQVMGVTPRAYRNANKQHCRLDWAPTAGARPTDV